MATIYSIAVWVERRRLSDWQIGVHICQHSGLSQANSSRRCTTGQICGHALGIAS